MDATNSPLEGAMDNTFQKIGVINYKQSKYATLFIMGSFIFFVFIGAVLIVLSGSVDSKRNKKRNIKEGLSMNLIQGQPLFYYIERYLIYCA